METVIVGAGVSGLVLALLLAKQGRPVFVYDKRVVFDEQTDGRSINFTISGRGLNVLTQLGLAEAVIAQSAILHGRILHLSKGKTARYHYGTQSSHVLLSIRRSTFITILMHAAMQQSHITLQLGFELMNIHDKALACDFFDSVNKKMVTKTAALIIGADGLFSQVRSCMLKKQMCNYQQTVFNWGYKEYLLDAIDVEKLQLRTDYMHMWPKTNALLVAIPNKDNTCSVILTAPRFNHDGHEQHFDAIIQREFSDIVCQSPAFLNHGDHPHNYMMSIKMDKWHWDHKIILIGDACHATYPFYGQGMNSALEDAVVLSHYLNHCSLSRLDAIVAYENSRKKDANALHHISESHLHQMTKAMISSFWQACYTLDFMLAKWLPTKWVYEYELIAHSSMRYSDILDVLKKQNKRKLFSGFYVIALLFRIGLGIQKLVP